MNELTQLMQSFGVYWPKFIAQIILFLIVWWVLNRFAFGPIITMLEQRRKLIEEGQLNAEKIKRQLAEAEIRYQEILRKANAEAQGFLDEARKSGEALRTRQEQDAIRSAEDIIAKAKSAIEVERNRMVSEVKSELVGLVVETTSKVVGKVLTPEDQKRLGEATTKQLAA